MTPKPPHEVQLDTLRHAMYGPRPSDEGVYKMAGKLALRGGFKTPSEVSSDAKPYCVSPVRVGRRVRPSQWQRAIEVSMWAPCRKCPRCLMFRRLKWLERMEREFATAKRTWFVTLTFDPIEMAVIYAEAHSAHDTRSFERRVDDAAYSRVQRFLKRVRKGGAACRYVFVFERGEMTGRPHYHALLHEVGPVPLTYRMICDKWPYLSHAKLVKSSPVAGEEPIKKSVRYISKYLGKSLDTRPRASREYGAHTNPAANRRATRNGSELETVGGVPARRMLVPVSGVGI